MKGSGSRAILIIIAAACLLTLAFFSNRKPVVTEPVSLPTAVKLQIEKVASIANTNHYPQRPVWSPDGKLIAFSRAKSDGIEVMNADGSNRRVLTTDIGSGYKFAWSPDSREIAYRYNDVQKSIYKIKKVNVKSGETELLHEQREELHPP